MPRKEFFSSFYGKNILPDDSRYLEIVRIESLWRYVDFLERDCTCYGCKLQKEKLHEYIINNIVKVNKDKKPLNQKE